MCAIKLIKGDERERLTEEEERILQSLADYGALTPSEISVKTLILPDEVERTIKELQAKELVRILPLSEQSQSVERDAYTLTSEGHRAIPRGTIRWK